jgi:hypothetical protein
MLSVGQSDHTLLHAVKPSGSLRAHGGQSMRAHWGPRHREQHRATPQRVAPQLAAVCPPQATAPCTPPQGPHRGCHRGDRGHRHMPLHHSPPQRIACYTSLSPRYHQRSTHAHANIRVLNARCAPREEERRHVGRRLHFRQSIRLQVERGTVAWGSSEGEYGRPPSRFPCEYWPVPTRLTFARNAPIVWWTVAAV